MSVKAADPSQSSSDVTLLKIKLSKLETELKSKILEIAEKYGMLESMESENCVLKEELEKQKAEIEAFKVEARMQRNRCVELRRKLEVVETENKLIKERLQHEAKVRAGIHLTK